MNADAASGGERHPSAMAAESSNIRDLLVWAESFAVMLTITTGLLVYAGSAYNGAFYGYFGLNSRMLQLTTYDQLMSSSHVVFRTGLLVAIVIISTIALDRPLERLGRYPATRRVRQLVSSGIPFTTIIILLGSALWLPRLWLPVSAEIASILLLAGAIRILRRDHSRRAKDSERLRSAFRTPTFLVIIVAIFWIATLYASETGRMNAYRADQFPSVLATVTVLSETPLILEGSSVKRDVGQSPTGSPVYRYSGLRLLTFSNNTYFLLIGQLKDYRSTVVPLMSSDKLRFEVTMQAGE